MISYAKILSYRSIESSEAKYQMEEKKQLKISLIRFACKLYRINRTQHKLTKDKLTLFISFICINYVYMALMMTIVSH